MPAAASARRTTSRPPGVCWTMWRSIMAARFGMGRSSARPNMPRCANSPLRWPKKSPRCQTSPPSRSSMGESARFKALVERKAAAGRGRVCGPRAGRPPPLPLIRCRSVPKQPPDLARGAQLFQQNCASCHGAKGDAQTADGAAARSAADRLRRPRSRQPAQPVRSVSGHQPGPRRHGDAELRPAARRRQMGARLPGGPVRLSRSAGRTRQEDLGQRSFAQEQDPRSQCAQLAVGKPAGAAKIGPDKAGPVIAYLRAQSRRRGRQGFEPRHRPRQRLNESLAAYRAGNRDEAKRLALAAYLDGFEPIEPMLGARNATLLAKVEQRMGELRAGIAANRDPGGDRGAGRRKSSPCSMRRRRRSRPTRRASASAFLGAFTILLREGLEALLIVVAMLAFLSKADRPELTRPVHVGWTSALAAGVLTWWVATSLITRQRREPRADRRLRIAPRGRRPAVRRHLDARQGAGRPVAALHPREAPQCAVRATRAGSCSRSPSSPSTARSSRRSCSSPRWRRKAASAASSPAALAGVRRAGGNRRRHAALQPAPADR